MKYLGFDCSYFCWRAFHTTGGLSFEGQPTGVIHGFLMQVLMISKQFGSTDPLFFWDSRKSLRKKVFPGYKDRTSDLTKAEMDERMECYEQIKILRTEVIPVLGFKNSFIQTGLEADDLLARFVRDNPKTTVVLTNDDDLLQLTDDCTWHSPQRKLTINDRAFRETYGIPPRTWRRVKQIAGCSSDTVPGVAGIGNKLAIDYLLGKMKTDGKRYANIVSDEGRAIAKRNRILVNLPFPDTAGIELQEDHFSTDGFMAICDTYGLKQLADEVGSWENHFRRIA